MRVLLYLMKHEGYSYKNDIFDESKATNDLNDPWAANCAIPQLLFQNGKLFSGRDEKSAN